MQALVLAGGEGTRLRPLTSTKPKPVLPLVNRPFLSYMLDWLKRHGVDEAIVSCGFLASMVRDELGDEACGVRLEYVEEVAPLGTAGAIKFAERLLDRRFLVLNGDVLTDIDLSALVELHEERGAVGSIALTPVDDPTNYGLVRTDEDGAILEFIEKPDPNEIDTNLINAGAYVLEREVLELIQPDERVSIECQVFPKLVGKGLYAKEDRAYWLDIGTPERYLQATYDILEGNVSSSVEVAGGDLLDAGSGAAGTASDGLQKVSVGKGTVIDESASITGPAAIGSGCEIGPGAVVERAAIHDDCEIGSDSTVRESVIASGVEIGSGVRIEGVSVVGEGARIGSGAVLSDGARIEQGERVAEMQAT